MYLPPLTLSPLCFIRCLVSPIPTPCLSHTRPRLHPPSLVDSTQYGGIALCGPGYWCAEGVRSTCPAGQYGGTNGLQTAACSGLCTAGFYCPAASSKATAKECGGFAVANGESAENAAKYFCPPGSATPTVVRDGYYTACDDDSTTLCSIQHRVKELPCRTGYLCRLGYERRFVEWDAGVCKCDLHRKGDPEGTTVCFPSAANEFGYLVTPEIPTDTLPPWTAATGAAGFYAYGWPSNGDQELAAIWYDETTGAATAVTDFEITNIRKYDTTGNTGMPCTGTIVDTATGAAGPFVIEPTKDKTGAVTGKPYLTSLTDFEDCQAWEFDLVAWTPARGGGRGRRASVCKVRWFVSDKSDSPYFTEPVTGGDRYGSKSPPTSPTLPSLATAREVEERTPRNTAVGSPLQAKDVDEGQEIFFAITGGNEDGMFRINKCSGQLYVAKDGLDFKVKQQYVLTISVGDDPDFYPDDPQKTIGDTTVTIEVLDVNDVPVICTNVATMSAAGCTREVKGFEMYEDAQPLVDSTVPVFGATYVSDLDGDPLQYSINAGEFDGSMFAIDANTGRITVAAGKELDYETKQYYKVTVIVEDMTWIRLCGRVCVSKAVPRGGKASYTFTITVLDANDAPQLAVGLVLPLPENSVVGAQTRASFSATDVDSTGGLTYTITTQQTGCADLAGWADVHGNTCSATNHWNGDICADAYVNQNSVGAFAGVTATTACCKCRGLAATTNAGTAVDYFGLTVPTAGAGLVFVEVTKAAAFDYESTSCPKPCQFVLTIQVADTGVAGAAGCGAHCGAKTSTGTIVVEISDVNEPPSLDTATAEVPENLAIGELVKTLTANDPEADDVTFLVHGTRATDAGGKCEPGGSIIMEWLSITAGGSLQSYRSIDFETLATNPFCVEIKIQDSKGATNVVAGGGESGGELYQAVKVTVLDVNEPPVLRSSQSFTVKEDAANGASLGAIVATDEDTGDSASVAIVSGASYAGVVQFVVGTAVNGDLKVAAGASLNFELRGTYTLAVEVTDTASPTPHKVSGSVLVHLEDVNEPPVVASALVFSVSEHNTAQADCTILTYCKVGTTVGYVTATDEDRVNGVPDTITFSIQAASNPGSTFAIDATSGAVTVKTITTSLTTEGHVFTLKVVATDSKGSPSLAADVKVTIVKVNYAPEFGSKASTVIASVPEDVAADTVLGVLTVPDPDKNYPITVSIKATDPPGFTASFRCGRERERERERDRRRRKKERERGWGVKGRESDTCRGEEAEMCCAHPSCCMWHQLFEIT